VRAVRRELAPENAHEEAISWGCVGVRSHGDKVGLGLGGEAPQSQ
jgi:hypothetical protein